MRLTWYIIRLHIGPFLFGTFAVVFIFLLQFIFKFVNELVGKGLTYTIIGKLILYNLAWMLVLAVPMGVLVATLMAYGKLSGNNELTIIKSSGGSAFRAMMPAIIGGAMLFGALYLFNDRVLPEANQRAAVLQNDIKQLKTSFAIEPGRFSTIQGFSILARRVDRAKNELLDVTIYGQENEITNVISAKRCEMRFTKEFDRLVMILYDGEIHRVNRRVLAEFRKISFAKYQVAISVSGYNFVQSDPNSFGRTDRTMNIDAMRGIADTALMKADATIRRIDSVLERNYALPDTLVTDTLRPPSRQEAATAALRKFATIRSQLELESAILSDATRSANQYLVEIHKKFSIPAACLMFVFVGAPLGIVVRRGNFGVSAAIALGFFVIYWACLILGEKLADRAMLTPFFAMWMANYVIGAMGLYLTILVSRETVTFGTRLFRRKRARGTGHGAREEGH